MPLPKHPYRPLIEKVCLATPPVPADVVESMMIVESNAVPSALSPSGAMGLLQIIYKYHAAAVDKAATDLGKRWGELALYDPEINLLAGTRILRWCYTSDGSQSWERAVRKYHSGSADPPADFKDGLGTTSDQHIAKFRAVYAEITGETQEEPDVTYQPKIIDKWLHVTQDGYQGVIRYHDRGPHGIQAFGLHVQQGTNWGSWQHHHAVKASATVYIAKNGDIWRGVPEDKAPWTNGDVNNPDAEVRALIAKYGPDPNTWMLTIEAEGYSGNLPYTVEQYQSILWQLREWKRKYGDKPLLRHGQINAVDRPYCPEPAPYSLTTRLKADLAADADTPPPPVYAVLEPIPGLEEIARHVEKFTTLPFTVKRRKVRAIRDTPRFQRTSPKSATVGPNIKKGEEFDTLAEVGGWYITPWGTRVWGGDVEIVTKE